MQINKLDAARRQLETAVRLYFSEGDPVSIHTLTAAAHQLLSDVNRAGSGTPMLKEAILRYAKPGKVDEVRRFLNSATNFFKHAERDPRALLTFISSQTEVFLFDACVKYQELTGEIVPTLGAYEGWFCLGPGADLVDASEEKKLTAFREAFKGHATDKRSFYRRVLPMLPTSGE